MIKRDFLVFIILVVIDNIDKEVEKFSKIIIEINICK